MNVFAIINAFGYKMAGWRRVDASSLPLQMNFYFHSWYVGLFLVAEIACLSFKGNQPLLCAREV